MIPLRSGNCSDAIADLMRCCIYQADDPLHDPMLDDGYVDYLINDKGAEEYAQMRILNTEVFGLLEKAFAHFKIQLVDLKLEYGIIDGQLHVIDEISGGSFRLWPYRSAAVDLKQSNVLSELDSEGRLDKDNYRMGKDFSDIMEKFTRIASITGRFSSVPS